LSLIRKQIYVEVERARLTHKLALMRENEGKMAEASNLLSELQVETFNSMDRREKVVLILEQIRFGLAKKDYIGTRIVAEKIQTKFFEDVAHQDLKLKHFRLMIELDLNEEKYLSVCKHYRAVFNTPSIQANVSEKQAVIKHVVLYVILAPHNNEQSDLIHRIGLDKYLEEVPKYNDLLKLFSTTELISWASLVSDFETILRVGTPESPATEVFSKSEQGEKHWKDLKTRVVEHNIRIMAKYYQRISIKRMSQLLHLAIEETEEVMSSLVVDKQIWAKVDRLEGVVNFTPTKHPNEVLNDWSSNINKLMASVCKVNHLINKEQMIHQCMHETEA
jgi:26S proteasome regulatory subunit N5